MELPTPEKEFELKSTFDDEGNLIFKKKSEILKGKKSKISGRDFELKVRKDLEDKGWIVDKWSNNVDLMGLGKIIPAKKKFNPFSKVMTLGTGFPDFIAMQKMGGGRYKVIAVEVKTNGNLSREEKRKAKWYLDNEIFAEFLVAKKVKENNRVRIEYVEFQKILERMRE